MVDKRKAAREALARAMNEFSSRPTTNRFFDSLTQPTEARQRPPDPYNPNNVPEDHPNNDPENYRLGPGLGRTTFANIKRLQEELNLERYGDRKGAPGPTPVSVVPKELRWQDFTYGQLNPSMTDDAERLTYWGKQWMTPTGADGYGSNSTAYRIFFAILAENGMSREDFNWTRFRAKYFSLDRANGGNQRELFKANQKARQRKGRKKK